MLLHALFSVATVTLIEGAFTYDHSSLRCPEAHEPVGWSTSGCKAQSWVLASAESFRCYQYF